LYCNLVSYFHFAFSYAILIGAPAAPAETAKTETKSKVEIKEKVEAKAKPPAAKPLAVTPKEDDFEIAFNDDDDEAPVPVPVPVEAPVKKEEFDSIFEADDDDATEEEKAATKARLERMANARRLKEEKDLKDGKKKSVKEAERSLVVLEVKPWEADTDLVALWTRITEYKQEGLTWGATYKLEPIAYGIMKLVLTCTIVDALVLLDDITENIEAIEEFVQSVNVSFITLLPSTLYSRMSFFRLLL